MRKVILNLAVSLDGFIEGPNGEYDWCLADQDYGMEEFFSHTDAIFIGRKSFEMIRVDAGMFPVKDIYVFSDTIALEPGETFRVIASADFRKTVDEIINTDGGDIWLFGGAELVSTFMNKRLVSEILLSIHPVILGGGKPLFKDIESRVGLNFIDQKTYDTGLLQVRYELMPWFDPEKLLFLG
ncbi:MULTISPECIES: dihydrofolate reductase family protein [unclassified Mucilaginibacter]|uniref:dihydrofolate reductase family protein n=1 Tax=unclassified Mucilaginibacter TaxID=2617802 RepID=UPI002AC8B88A|nr:MULTISPECIES: dihydrofolate reductase family protein [unclassified Mucilaginibacter]MEB0262007.1 dihydrofolate reductase family protein [Mucilaginibacter sp. 10I4]MEB0279729.1 dihydrofolate reductase family protein [Mucilaginibacter sp. 10B2]MEB0301678.1 dihydrofolate reductase family protein [Mucilaginibacter sp. 5C4]WPX23712.1 dihydrofolate reductase family protein [Mucilaginibacter sp. 5C4]